MLRIMVVADRDLLILTDRAALNSADADPADIFVIVDGGDEHLQRLLGITLRRGDIVDDGIKERIEIHTRLVGAVARDALSCGAEKRGGLKLLVGRIEVEQQLQDLLHDLFNARVQTVDLVDDNNDLVSQLQRLLQHEARLGHGALCRVDQQDNAVDHLQNTLDLAAEIGVTRGVDNVDLCSLIVNGGIFGKDRDAALAL